MKGIVFNYKLSKLAISKILGTFSMKGYFSRFGYLQYKDIPDPTLFNEEWVIIRPEFCGICGSDTKQSFLDGNMDNPMTAMISWPQVLGHEVVGYIKEVGSAVDNVKVGDRVVLNPWISCLPRGIKDVCWACKEGKNTLCRNFKKGILAPGIHTGNSKDVTGGFAELVPAHKSMVYKIPEGITWEQAILSDPFSVAFHSVLKVRPPPGSVCLVYGCGNLGLLTVHILKKIFKDIKVIAIARFHQQIEMAKQFGADLVLSNRPVSSIIEKVAEYVQCEIYYIDKKKKKGAWLIEGVDFVFDTVASPETLETGLKIVRVRIKDPVSNTLRAGAIVVTGVASPKRFEWTPWYFKDVDVIGSNAFAIEEFEGRKEHSYLHYFRFLKEKRVDPSAMVTHKFLLQNFPDALIATKQQGKSGALKVALYYDHTGKEAMKNE